MTHRAREVGESGVYHVTARGVGRQIIFESDGDRRHLTDSLLRLKAEHSVEVLAWCLMDNHIHLLLRGDIKEISHMMRRLLGSFAMRFNALYGRTGHLFQDRFHSKPVEAEGQLLAVLRYIHLNPKDAGLDYTRYAWSSFSEYADGRPWLADTAFIWDVVGDREAFLSLHAGEGLQAAGGGMGEMGRSRLAAAEVDAVFGEILGQLSPFDLKALDKRERDGYIVGLREAGVSVRQIERKTGIGRGVISRARRRRA